METLLDALLEKYKVFIIYGGKYELFQRQVLSQLTTEPQLLKKLHLMSTSGTRYYTYDENKHNWHLNYAEDFASEQKAEIIATLECGLEESGYKDLKTYGDTIEDRDSQITLSILGQEIVAEFGDEGVRIKDEWDLDWRKISN